MGYYKELDIARRNAAQFGVAADDDADLLQLAVLLGGEVDGDFVRCSSPGHPPDDRSCFIRFKGGLDDFFIYDCTGPSGAAYAFVRAKLRLEPAPKRDYSDIIARLWSETLPAPDTTVERFKLRLLLIGSLKIIKILEKQNP